MMMVEWTAALMIAAAPTTVLSVTDLEESLPKIKRALTWASQANSSLAPRRANHFLDLIKIDLFNAEQWATLGLDKNKTVYVWSLPEQHVQVVEISVKNKKRVDALLREVFKKHPLAQSVIDQSGFWIAPQVGQFLAAIRIKNRLYLQSGRKSGGLRGGAMAILSQLLTSKAPPAAQQAKPISFQDDRLLPTRNVINHRKPRIGAKRRTKTSAIWLHHLNQAHTFVSGPVNLSAQGMQSRLLLSGPDFKNSEARRYFQSSTKSRRLFDSAVISHVAGEVQAQLTASAMRQWSSDQDVKIDVSKLWTGEVHALLMKSGALLVALPVRKEASASMRTAMKKALRLFAPKLKQLEAEAFRGEIIHMIWWGDVSEKSMRKLLLKSKPIYAPTMVAAMNPPAFLQALKNRSAAHDRWRLSGAKLLMIELFAGPLMKSAKSAGASLVVSPNKAELTLMLNH